MAGDLTLALRTAQSGLSVNQTALNTVANNVANANTEGYTRKIVNLEHRVLAGAGAGVQVASLVRKVDEQLIASARTELSSLNAASAQESYFSYVQDLFGSPEDNASIAHQLAQFTAASESLATDPDSALAQQEVVLRGEDVANTLQHMTDTLQDLRRQADAEIADAVEEINSLIATIADLNVKVVATATVGHDVAGLQDQRDVALNRLAELVDISVYDRGNGDLVVFTTGGQVPVDSSATTVTHTEAAQVSAATTYAEGDFSAITTGNLGSDLTETVRGGKLYGLIQMRDSILPDMQSSLDELASELRDTVNQIHNRGTPLPGLQDMSGTRRFIRPDDQTITLTGGGDTAIVLMDVDGNQTAATTLETIMQSASYGSGAQAAGGPWDITEVAATLEDWLQASGAAGASVTFDGDGRVQIELNTPDQHLAFRDEAADGSAEDLAIAFDSDGDGATDETVAGFSYFFGLNDFFVDGRTGGTMQTDVLATAQTVTVANLTFHDASGLLGVVAIGSDVPLADTAAHINAADIGVTASLVPDGGGVRLRIQTDGSSGLTVTDGGAGVLNSLGFADAETGVAGTLDVRADIQAAPTRVTRGSLQFDVNRGAAGTYAVGPGDDTVARALADELGTGRAFDAAGRMGVPVRTFEEYASALISDNSALAERNTDTVEYQSDLVTSLQAKANQVSGVDLDEELSNLILYEQAYSSAARVVDTIRSMFEALEQAVT